MTWDELTKFELRHQVMATIWHPPDSPFPAHKDHASEEEANRHALTMSRLLNDEVAVVPLTNQGDSE